MLGSICPVCVEGQMSEKIEKIPFQYKGCSGHISVVYSFCDACESSVANDEQITTNKQAALKFKRIVEKHYLI